MRHKPRNIPATVQDAVIGHLHIEEPNTRSIVQQRSSWFETVPKRIIPTGERVEWSFSIFINLSIIFMHSWLTVACLITGSSIISILFNLICLCFVCVWNIESCVCFIFFIIFLYWYKFCIFIQIYGYSYIHSMFLFKPNNQWMNSWKKA